MLCPYFCVVIFHRNIYHNSCWKMLQMYSRISFIRMLSSWTTRTGKFHFYFIHIELHIQLIYFWHDSYCDSWSMNTTFTFCFRNSLYSVYSRFVFKTRYAHSPLISNIISFTPPASDSDCSVISALNLLLLQT